MSRRFLLQLRNARVASATTASSSSSSSSSSFSSVAAANTTTNIIDWYRSSRTVQTNNVFDRRRILTKTFATSSASLRAAAGDGGDENNSNDVTNDGDGGSDPPSSSSGGEGELSSSTSDSERKNKRLTRKDKGSYAGMLTEIDSYESHELHGTNLYDTREHIGLEEERERVFNEVLERLERIKNSDEYKERWAKERAEIEEEEKNGTRRILEWETNLVLEAGGTQDHGLNKKVSLRVNVDALMKETGLSEEAMEYIKAICGKRFLKKTNEIRIVCRRYRDREHNRQWCLRALYELIEEGQKEFPSSDFKREDIIELNAKRRSELGESETYVSEN